LELVKEKNEPVASLLIPQGLGRIFKEQLLDLTDKSGINY